MDLLEFSDIIQKQIVIRNRDASYGVRRWYARFENSEIIYKEHFLKGEYGDGGTPDEALSNYAKKISGETLVFDAMSKEKRREYKVPELNGG